MYCAIQSAYINYNFPFVCLIFISINKSINQTGMCFVKVCRSINFNNLIRKGNKFKSCLIHINYTVTPYLPITFLNHMQLHQMFVNTLMQGINLNHVYMNICFSEWMVDREVIRLIKLHFFQHLVINVVKQLTLYKRCGVAEWLMCSFA